MNILIYGIKEQSAVIDDTTMNYVEFGQGSMPLIILPGLSDGLKTVKGQSINLAFYFREFLKDFKVYVFSRKEKMNTGYGTEDMAKDLKSALDQIGIEKICLMGVSQGGMIAQWFAIHYPDVVKKLVLAVSASQANETLKKAVNTWTEYARDNDYKSLMVDTLEKTYSPAKLKLYRLAYPILTRIGKPDSFERFLLQADAVQTHNALDELKRISCPTLIAGGDHDYIVGKDASLELSKKIPDNRLIVYEGLGHAAYEEGKDFNKQVKNFLLSCS